MKAEEVRELIRGHKHKTDLYIFFVQKFDQIPKIFLITFLVPDGWKKFKYQVIM